MLRTLPSSWKKLVLNDIVSDGFRNGYSPNCPDEPNGNWILSLGNMTDSGFNPKFAKPAPLNDAKVKNFSLKPGDFLISRSNTLKKVGRVIQFNGELENCSYPDLMIKFRIDSDSVYIDYLEFFLRSELVRRYIEGCASGTSNTMVKINKQIIKKIPIILPPVSEQKSIGDLFSIWDKAIDKTEKLIKAKEKLLHALYQVYFDPRIMHSSLWKEVKIGELLTSRNEKVIPSETSPLFSLTIEDGITAKTDRYNREALVKDVGKKKYKIVCQDDFVFNPSNLRWGAIARSFIPHDVVISPIYEVLSICENRVDTDFLMHLLKSPRQIRIYASRTEGTLIERQAVKLDVFLLLKICIPDTREEQQKIARIFNLIQEEIYLLEQMIEKYRIQKNGLMLKLFTGEWRVTSEDK